MFASASITIWFFESQRRSKDDTSPIATVLQAQMQGRGSAAMGGSTASEHAPYRHVGDRACSTQLRRVRRPRPDRKLGGAVDLRNAISPLPKPRG